MLREAMANKLMSFCRKRDTCDGCKLMEFRSCSFMALEKEDLEEALEIVKDDVLPDMEKRGRQYDDLIEYCNKSECGSGCKLCSFGRCELSDMDSRIEKLHKLIDDKPKEITRVFTVEITDITKSADKNINADALEQYIKADLNLDDVKVTNVQTFERYE